MPHQVVDWFGDQSVVVVDLALACCAIESELAVPAGAPRLDAVPPGARVVAVDSYIAGCPPPPGALAAVVEQVRASRQLVLDGVASDG